MATEPTTVEAYSSYTLAVEPRAFTVRGKHHRVESVVRTWRTPDRKHFRVVDEYDESFELCYDEVRDMWSLVVPGDTEPEP